MSIQNIALDQVKETKEVYLLSPRRMFSEYRGEKENVKNYNGRQLLEMLQNAEDAANKATGIKKVLIKLQENQLIIANTGYPFSEEGLTSLFYSHLSPKAAQEQQIGNKGLGFRSILSWANKITIKSHDLHVAFSKDFSKTILQELLKNSNFNKSYHKLKKTDEEIPISTLVCPEVITADTNEYAIYSEYDTIIQIYLKEAAIKQVISQLEKDIDGEVLIFLNNLERIELDVNGVITTYSKKILGSTIQLITNDNVQSERLWNINTISGNFEDLNRDYQLSVAWKDELDDQKDVIYSYFRTKVPFHFSGILHGTFELNADRNDIITDEDGYNQKLISLIPTLIANTAEKIANKEIEVNYNALSFTIFENYALPNIIQKSDFDIILRNELLNKKIFPTIDNKYTSAEDEIVYFKDDIFAKLLPTDSFPKLLIPCDNESITKYISSFKPLIYTFEYLCAEISARITDYSIEEYAALIVALIDIVDFDKEEGKSKICLFFDLNLNLLSFDNPIFLPSDSKYEVPSEIGVQIIHQDLAEQLKKHLCVDSYEAVAHELSKYKIKIFDFSAIVEIMIKHYYSEKATIEDIKKLNRTIFNLYFNEKTLSTYWTGSSVPLITKDEKIELANKLYFGKEYECKITDAIYNYNNNKLVTSMKAYNIQENDYLNWKSYLRWLGVAEFPRKIQVKGSKDFVEYAMLNYNFRNKIGDKIFKNYSDFKNTLNSYSEIKVTSIDDLDLILLNNNSENILLWLNLDKDLFQQIESDKEPDSSTISFWFYQARNTRRISGKKISNFIKWKLSNTAWLDTKSGIKKSPCLCTTSSTITDEFSPFIEKPNIDYTAKIFIEHNVKPDKIDYLLNVVGVNKTISSFKTEILYSILLELPQLDPDGEKAKPLYRELATNFDEKYLDKRNEQYKGFISNGLVFCKKNGENGYENVHNVYYVDNKRYGESIIKQFFTLEVDRRRGKKKIEILFGVKPLEKLDLDLIDQPIPHILNNKFEQEIENFKPYVYIFRQHYDNTGREKNIIKDAKFRLVTTLSVSLIQENGNLEFDLSDYDYIYLAKNKTVYIRIPYYLDNIHKLKDDISFCSTISEVFSSLIDVDAQRQQIRELFSKSISNRDDIIRTELDDSNLEKLMAAKQKLGIINDPKINFWRAFVKCFPSIKLKLNDETDEELLEELKKHFPEYSDQISIIIDKINYDNYNEDDSLRLIIELLTETNVSIKRFNIYAYPTIDVSELHKFDFKRMKENKKRDFKQIFYSSFLEHNIPKKDFLLGMQKYDSIEANCKNVIDYDVEEDLRSQVQELFQLDLVDVIDEYNFEDIYSKNKAIYENRAEKEGYSKEIANQFLNEKQSVGSLLYFRDEVENIIINLKKWIPIAKDDKSDTGRKFKKNKLSVGVSPFLYDDYSDLFNQLETSWDSDQDYFQINLSKIKIKRTKNNSFSSNRTGSFSQRSFSKPKEDVGFLGEYIVYKHLLSTSKNKESVKWVSEYAKLAGVNLDGTDGKGYDIEYIPNEAKYPRYVEVKVVGGENAFHITSNEIIQGEKLKEYYEIFLVKSVTSPEKITIEIIQGPFKYKGQQGFNDNELFTVVNDTFILKFEKNSSKQ